MRLSILETIPIWGLLLLLLAPWLLLSCGPKADMDELTKIVMSNEPSYGGLAVSKETANEVGRLLKRYQRDVKEIVGKAEELGTLYKEMGLGYLELGRHEQRVSEILTEDSGLAVPDDGVFAEALGYGFFNARIFARALESFELAISVFPENGLLYYYAGISAANLGKASVGRKGMAERASWFARAEAYYLRAVEIDPRHVGALYALAVIYVFELNRTADAEPLLDRIMKIESRNIDALFLLGTVVYKLGRLEEAVALYERIEELTKAPVQIAEAEVNRKRILEELYGSGQ